MTSIEFLGYKCLFICRFEEFTYLQTEKVNFQPDEIQDLGDTFANQYTV